MIVVRVLSGERPVIHRVEDFPCLIGRSLQSEIRIDDPTVSGRHAELRVGPSGFVLVDLGSTNGITRDGMRVVDVHLDGNTTVLIGDVKLEIVIEEALPKTHSNRLPNRRLLGPVRHDVPRVIVTVTLSYLLLCLLPASERYKYSWPPDRPYGILASALYLWALFLGLAFVISLFCKLNSRRFHFWQVLALMVLTFIFGRFFQQFAPTLIFNLHNFPPARFLLHLGFGALAFVFFYQLQRFAFHHWTKKLRAMVAGGMALAVMLLVEVYVDAKVTYGDRDRMTQLGLPLLDPRRIRRSPDELLFDVALKVAEVDQKRIRALEKIEAEKD